MLLVVHPFYLCTTHKTCSRGRDYVGVKYESQLLTGDHLFFPPFYHSSFLPSFLPFFTTSLWATASLTLNSM